MNCCNCESYFFTADELVIYTPNLGLANAILVRGREQGRFRKSNRGAPGRSKRAKDLALHARRGAA